MADRESARLFGEVFKALASELTPENLGGNNEKVKAVAERIWSEVGWFDFLGSMMGADNECVQLGLAHKEREWVINDGEDEHSEYVVFHQLAHFYSK